MSAGRILELWRYPVKSMAGERLDRARLDRDGVVGDRALAFRDVSTGRIVSAKRAPELLTVRPTLGDDVVIITFPDGRTFRSDDDEAVAAVSSILGRAVTFARDGGGSDRPEIEDLDGTFRGRPGPRFFDSSPIHVVTTSTLERLSSLYPKGEFDPRRFRPNIVVEAEAFDEDWIGSTFRIGSARLTITKVCRRCVMTTAAQPGLPQDRGILSTVAHLRNNVVGVYAQVDEPGDVGVGDDLVPA